MKRSLDIATLLDEEGPLTSSSILRRLEAAGSTPAASRKRLQRLDTDVRRLHHYGLPKNQQLLYRQYDWLSPRFKEAIIRAWEESKSAHANALAVLPDDGTPVPKSLLHVRSGAPINLKGQVGFDRLIDQLSTLELVKTQDVPELGPCVTPVPPFHGRPSPPQHVRAGHLAERIVITSLREWLRKLGLISYDAGSLRGDDPDPEFAQFPFDLVSPATRALLHQHRPGRCYQDLLLLMFGWT